MAGHDARRKLELTIYLEPPAYEQLQRILVERCKSREHNWTLVELASIRSQLLLTEWLHQETLRLDDLAREDAQAARQDIAG